MSRDERLAILEAAVSLTQHITKPQRLEVQLAKGMSKQAELVLANYLDVLGRVHEHLRATHLGEPNEGEDKAAAHRKALGLPPR